MNVLIKHLEAEEIRLHRLLILIRSERYQEYYNHCDEVTKGVIQRYVLLHKIDFLEAWFKSSKTIDELSVDDLRRMARGLGIKDAHLMRQHELLLEIKNVNYENPGVACKDDSVSS